MRSSFRPLIDVANDRFWPIMTTKLAGQIRCNRWSERMQMTGQVECKRVFKWSAISQLAILADRASDESELQ